MNSLHRIVVIGVSAGGLDALSTVIPQFPESLPAPVVIVQHRRPDSDEFLATHLDERSPLPVSEAEDKEPIRAGHVYLAPAGYHLLIENDATFGLSVDERVNYCRPSIDVLFESAACVFQSDVIGVVLTGANTDGSRGLSLIKQLGGVAVVQDPATAAASCLPISALNATPVDRVLALDQIAPFVVSCLKSEWRRSTRSPSLENPAS